MFPTSWKNKITLKVRRASQLQHLWIKCSKLLLRRKLVIPKRIAIPNIFLHIFNPLILIVMAILSALVFFQFPLFLLAFLLILCPIFLFRRTRPIILEALQTNLILLAALTSFFSHDSFRLWKTTQESRSLLTEDILKEKQLL